MRVSHVLAILIILGYVIGVISSKLGLLIYLIQVNSLVYQGYYYQLITSILITDSLIDALFNSLSIIAIDYIFKPKDWKILLIFLITGILGNSLSLLYDPYTVSSGASGALFGVLGYLVTDEVFNEYLKVEAIIFLIIVFISSSVIPGVDVLAHIGGLASGVILYIIFRHIGLIPKQGL